MTHIEVEVRGKIDSKEFNKVIKLMKKKTQFIEKRERLTLTYFRDKVCKDVRNIKDEKIDLRLRITDKKAEIILKYGKWGAKDNRKEISIPIELDKFDDAVELLSYIGWNHGILTTTKTWVFEYKGIEFAIVEQNNVNHYFEAEKVTSNNKNINKIHREIEDTCAELNLKSHNEEEFLDFMNELNKYNVVYDFNKHNFSDFKRNLRRFFK